MQLRKVMGMLAVASFTIIFIAGCGKKSGSVLPGQVQTGQTEYREYPDMIYQAFEDPELAGKIFAIGYASASDARIMRARAEQEADRRIAAFFEQHKLAITRDYVREVNGDPEAFTQIADEVRIDQTIRGSQEFVKYTTKVVKDDGTTTLYVIKYIEAQKLLDFVNDFLEQLQSIGSNENAATIARATEAFKEIDAMAKSNRAIRSTVGN